MTDHTQRCLDLQKKTQEKIDAWLVLHPNYCKDCHGYGEIETRDSVPYGAGNTTLVQQEDCECICNARCPHCGSGLIFPEDNNSEEAHCSKCDWNNTKIGKDGLPEGFDGPCSCEWKEIKSMQNEMLYGSRPENDWLEQHLTVDEMRKEMVPEDPDEQDRQDEKNMV